MKGKMIKISITETFKITKVGNSVIKKWFLLESRRMEKNVIDAIRLTAAPTTCRNKGSDCQ